VEADDYDTKNLVILEGLEPVRLRPGMYVGDTKVRGLHHVVMEVVGNSLDQVLAGHAKSLEVGVSNDGWVRVEDDGRGISVEPFQGLPFLELIFTRLSYLPTVDGHHPHVHITPRLHGVGVGVVSALSSRLEVESRTGGTTWRAAFERGVCVERARSVGPASTSGTTIRLLPDTEIFNDTKLDLDVLRNRLSELAWFLPALELKFQGQALSRPDGLRGWVLENSPDAISQTIVASTRTIDDVQVDFALGWSPTRQRALTRSFVNLTRTERGGTHADALAAALQMSAPDMHEWNVAKNGLVAIVHVRLLHPRFGGPTKELLESEEPTPVVIRAVREAITPAFWEAIRTGRPSME